MGILNVTPDSFSDGGKYLNVDKALSHCRNLIKDGADIIDIGGESTKPGSELISPEEEIERVIPVLKKIQSFSKDTIISIDTTKSKVAKKAIEFGADIINDVSGLSFDAKMSEVVSDYDVHIIIMHMKGTPKNMQINPKYDFLINEISSFFNEKIKMAINSGIKKDRIIIDPGIGFGKTINHNFQILNKLNDFSAFGLPIMIGPSRKSFIGLTLDLPIDERIEGTSASVTAGIMNGARIVRVHDVKEIKRVVKIADRIRKAI
ncbi:MAG: dihydropteroate synthase [Candidatus Marinimicrobia bacterium]|nr:dihydropteroate synthase [Candidatus Neomarinimicrobiota bacterium]